MTTHIVNLFAALVTIALVCSIYCLVEANYILAWYERQYNREPRRVPPPKRSRIHRVVLFLLRFPVYTFKPKLYIPKH